MQYLSQALRSGKTMSGMASRVMKEALSQFAGALGFSCDCLCFVLGEVCSLVRDSAVQH